jgi:hypothetical protein
MEMMLITPTVTGELKGLYHDLISLERDKPEIMNILCIYFFWESMKIMLVGEIYQD